MRPMTKQPQYCTEKCTNCQPILMNNGSDSYVCLIDKIEVIPEEIDLTPGVGQTSPCSNTICPHDTWSRPAPAADACLWSEDDEGNWHTGCGQIHQFTNGTPKENHHEYCPYCGKPLREVAP